jgi:hypothetical protein
MAATGGKHAASPTVEDERERRPLLALKALPVFRSKLKLRVLAAVVYTRRLEKRAFFFAGVNFSRDAEFGRDALAVEVAG